MQRKKPLLFTTNESFIQYLSSIGWETRVGGPLGLHTDTIPKIWDGTYDVGAVPGIAYLTTFMDGYTNQTHTLNIEELTDFIEHCKIGTMIYQRIPTYLPKRKKITYLNFWVKFPNRLWSVRRTIASEGVIRTPWGAEGEYQSPIRQYIT